MQVVYAQKPLDKSIFLAGPTPRDRAVPSWRPAAVEQLRALGFQGKVFVPEVATGGFEPGTYDRQIQWEWEALNQATVVLFWVPRELATLPGFTTNVEFGMFANSAKLLLGFPESAHKMRYMHRLAHRHGVPCYSKLDELLQAAIARAENPYPLEGAEEVELAF